MPTFPQTGLDISKDQAFHMLLGSIAMEELALSHMMNAEGEKIQHLLGTLPNSRPSCATSRELLQVNQSVAELMQHINQSQLLLKSKLAQVLAAMECHGSPTPPARPALCILRAGDGRWRAGDGLRWRAVCGQAASAGAPPQAPSISLPPWPDGMLVQYSIQLQPCQRGAVSIAVQALTQGVWMEVATSESYVCLPELSLELSGSALLLPSPDAPCPTELCVSLREPCAVMVKRGTLTLTQLPQASVTE